MTRPQPIEVARWYPAPPPALPGENDDQYTDRLTGADKTGRVPYDHTRNRQCSIGYHMECSRWRTGETRCQGPCHSDTAVPADAVAGLDDEAVQRMRELYSLPQRSARRVIYLGQQALDNHVNTLDAFRQHIGAAYNSEISEGFAIDVIWALGCDDCCVEGCPPAPKRHRR